jgi:hypothetical protein
MTVDDRVTAKAIAPENADCGARSGFVPGETRMSRLPRGTALRVMIGVSLLIWCGLVALAAHFWR